MKTLKAFGFLAVIAFAGFGPSAHAQSTDCRDNNREIQIGKCTNAIKNARSDSERAAAHLYRCQAYDILGQYAEALADCQEAGRLNPSDNSVHNSISIIYQNLGRHDQAIAASSRAISGNDSVAGYFNTRSNAHCKAGNINASMNDRMLAMNKGLYTPQRIQEILKNKGYYNGPLDGNFGGGSRAALESWTRDGCK
ncbi:MAG: tetratricopeptide repeat protein [Pseudomonadota bacterium]